MSKPKQKLKNLVVTALKLSVAAGLIYWMTKSGKLELDQLRILIDRPEILAFSVFIWAGVALCLCGVRWRLLLRGLGIDVGMKRILQLTAIGLFFNSAMPGAVGGDLIKAVYVLRETKSKRRTPALMSIILDRVIGLFGLFTFASISVVFNLRALLDSPTMHPMVIFIFTCFGLSLLFIAAVFFPHKEGKDPFEMFFSLKLRGIATLQKLYTTLRSYRHQPRYLIYPWAISVVAQFIWFLYYLTLTEIVSTGEVRISALATVFPIGVLTTAIPITPGGLGVGHVAFDKLYEMIGLTSGATVFNIACLGQLSLNMFGILPYLFGKSKMKDISAEELSFDEQPAGQSGLSGSSPAGSK